MRARQYMRPRLSMIVFSGVNSWPCGHGAFRFDTGGVTAVPFRVAVDVSRDDPDGRLLVHRAGEITSPKSISPLAGVVTLGLRG